MYAPALRLGLKAMVANGSGVDVRAACCAHTSVLALGTAPRLAGLHAADGQPADHPRDGCAAVLALGARYRSEYVTVHHQHEVRR